MNKLFILALISLSVVLACHSSCNCDAGSNRCNSCVDTNSSVDSYQRSCPCRSGWYTGQLAPFQCAQYLNTNANGDATAVFMDACHIEIGKKTKDILINTNCHYEVLNNLSYVVSAVSLNYGSISFLEECKPSYVTSVQYRNPANGNYEDVPAKYVTNTALAGKTLTFPLIDVYDLTGSSGLNTNGQISQTVNLQIKIGHANKFVRHHRWDLIVYTNRDQVQVFNLDVDVQRTDGCQPGQECIVVADLQTQQQICTDASCSATNANPVYAVGDIFYAKISFTDASYTKRLTFVSLYFLNDLGQVFNFSQITSHSWANNGLVISLPLVEPTLQAKIQVNMLIEAAARMRSLQNESTQTSSKFTATVLSAPTKATTNQAQSNNAFTILFGLVNFFALALMI